MWTLRLKSIAKIAYRTLVGPRLYERLEFWRHLGYWPNLDDLRTFNEKVCARKFRPFPLAPILADKLAVREFVWPRVGANILTRVYYSGESPEIASEHTNYQHYSHRQLQALLLRLVPGLADLMTCVSEQVRQTYPSFLRKRMRIIPTPVSLDITASADVLAHSRQRKTLLQVGRLDAGKDQATLINAFAKLAPRVADWDPRIVGEGVLRSQLEKQIATLGVTARIRVLIGTFSCLAARYPD